MTIFNKRKEIQFNRMKACLTLLLPAEFAGLKKAAAVISCLVLFFFYSYGFAQIGSETGSNKASVADSKSEAKMEGGSPAADGNARPETTNENAGRTPESSENQGVTNDNDETGTGAESNENSAGNISNKQGSGNQSEKKEVASGNTIIKESAQVPVDGLLPITDGNYKYKRIPEIKLQNNSNETEAAADISAAIEDSSADQTEKDTSEKEGSMTNTIVLIIVAILIIGVILLFKLRSKKSSDKVLRRLPGS